MSSYILIIVFMLHTGNIHVAHEGKPDATRMSLEQCRETMKERMEQGQRMLPWLTAECKEIPVIEINNNKPGSHL